ncbi:MAG: SpoIIE family protein phosphatase, partial [Cellulomonadaceae bacterium]|nr:SpoIIE family protein phosphatase [Cellulomonadaceae bacterium]
VRVVPPAFLVADGVSGSGRGDAASGAAVDCFLAALGDGPPADLVRVHEAVVAADRGVRALATAGQAPATTLSGVVLLAQAGAPTWVVLNVGDSRVYRYEQGVLEQLTVDHVAERPAGRRGARTSQAITRALGAYDSATDLTTRPVTRGERLLLCTDGVHGVLPDETLRAALTVGGTPSSVAQALVRLAVRAGSRDDVTVAVVDVRAGGLAAGQRYETTHGATTDDDTVEVRL